jgi:hypothetical protein
MMSNHNLAINLLFLCVFANFLLAKAHAIISGTLKFIDNLHPSAESATDYVGLPIFVFSAFWKLARPAWQVSW